MATGTPASAPFSSPAIHFFHTAADVFALPPVTVLPTGFPFLPRLLNRFFDTFFP